MSESDPVFVIQKHDASRLHYDFRLEVNGTLKSWVVPKGIPSEKRLAMQTEDHPMDYAYFEGVIPQGEYGGGTVLVWDCGTYENITQNDNGVLPISDAIQAGHALIRLKGKKISGGYALQCIGNGEDTRWLLMKMNDDDAKPSYNPISMEPESVLSGRTIEEIADGAKK